MATFAYKTEYWLFFMRYVLINNVNNVILLTLVNNRSKDRCKYKLQNAFFGAIIRAMMVDSIAEKIYIFLQC